ncbi:phosphoglycerate kinase [Geomonas sp. Red69]|uniref:Phosphoglycerate kinase n=1 Tax=Geomonas diazotrophica TaxID=2843197 RepID=A0ABX8JPD0_9BACT|nr:MULTISPECIES: phosphoglycerate kinase [Geomonas]MBU5637246.1 phosphoglycerate kinase [Geomonas diazotrophica]QWV99539.1 phosphoglycerate kinase [Geomonas nitrogeniifigens]QXE88714.1 phosphoglycerate kinase [Geomonas nitrogeniifigens]
MSIRYIDEIESLAGKKLFMRVDFNVPLDDNQNITEDTRIRAVLPTLNYALDQKAKIVLASHLGRPKGERKEKYSMAPAAKRLSRLLGKEVKLASDCIGDEVRAMIDAMQPGDVVMLENVRFYAGEEKNDVDFAKALANGCEVYVNDAFAVSHRAHASVEAITDFFPVVAAGFLMKNEMNYFEKAMKNPIRPLVSILGGAKVSGKIEVLENLCDKVDKIIIGGGMAFTFLKGMGYNVGKSLVEDNLIETAMKTYEKARAKGVKFYLPVDCVVADQFNPAAETKVCPIQEIPEGWMALDIGPATVALFTEALQNAKTIVWNGPMGVFEMDAFSRGTFAMVSAVANSYALTIVGGGDTDVAVHRAGEYAKISYISTGGGAFLELLEGKKLPGIKVLEDKGHK